MVIKGLQLKHVSFEEFLEIEEASPQEGLVFLGAGGPPNSWVDGVRNDLIDEGIVKKEDGPELWTDAYLLVSTGGRRDLVLFFDGSKVDVGRLPIWRIRWAGDCKWASDFVVNYRTHYGMKDFDEEEPDED